MLVLVTLNCTWKLQKNFWEKENFFFQFILKCYYYLFLFLHYLSICSSCDNMMIRSNISEVIFFFHSKERECYEVHITCHLQLEKLVPFLVVTMTVSFMTWSSCNSCHTCSWDYCFSTIQVSTYPAVPTKSELSAKWTYNIITIVYHALYQQPGCQNFVYTWFFCYEEVWKWVLLDVYNDV